MVVTQSGVAEIDYKHLASEISKSAPKRVYSAIANAPYADKVGMAFLFLGFICIYIVDEKTNKIFLKGVSDTEEYHLAVKDFKFKPSNYHLDFDKNKDNQIVQAIAQNTPQQTGDWTTLNRGKTSKATVRLNQASSGIATSIIYPLNSKIRGALMYSYYQYPEMIGNPQQLFMERYTELVSACLA